jgi:lysophospholipase L1-like esterase
MNYHYSPTWEYKQPPTWSNQEGTEATDDTNAGIEPKKEHKVYALLVGIADYAEEIKLAGGKVRFPKLSGCVRDVEKMRDYLSRDIYYKADIKMLTDKDAFKAEIVRLFKEHLGKAEENDTALFYFSGHGTQEFTDQSIFASETDGKLESLACYYNEQSKDNFLLADKELRWLISQVAAKKPHIVTIFDCCHSADITRNGALVTSSFDKVVEKRAPFVFPRREWDQFIFGNDISSDVIAKTGEYIAITEGLHVQLSACESNESAVEVSGEGVFTKALLKVLQATGGNITYHSLRSRIRQYLQSIYEQKPRLYIPNNDQNVLYASFLNKPAGQNSNAFAEVTYNDKISWQLNCGAIHGIGGDTKSLKVFDPQSKETTYEATLGGIKTDSAQLTIDAPLDKAKTYYAYIENFMSQTIRVHVAGSNALLTDQETLMNELLKATSQAVVFQDKEEDAQYVLRFLNGRYHITLPNDPYRPLAKPIEADSEKALSVIASYFTHILKWQFVKNIANQDESTRLSTNSVRIEMALGNNGFATVDDGEKATVEFSRTGKKWKSAIRIRLTNNTENDLYCCALYLLSNFQSYTGFLNPPVYMLEKGNTVELTHGGKMVLSVSFGEDMRWYNWERQTDFFKFIISTEIFDAEALVLEQLPSPVIPQSRDRGSERGIDISPDVEREKVSDWYTKDVALEMKNPEFNLVSEEDLHAMLDDERTIDFALGLYYDGTVDENLQPTYVLKPSIKLKDAKEELAERGILQEKLIDLANQWARRQRNRLYQKIIKRFPDRVRIVSEGDSWFQHPLVLDVIDHLSRTYAVYCVAAAGDTLRNMQSGKSKEGEYYLDALDREQPAFFLVSAGGNDILGSQFRSYLQDKWDEAIDEGKSPERFLRESIFKEMASLADVYRSLFQSLKQSHPKLQIIVHGYDYPIKLDDAKKGWLGRYMIEKGIKRPGDRRAIIQLIMDEFNRRLKKVAVEFDNVTYIDLRGTVRYNPTDKVDQWYDEIHPNDEGFQQIAMKYMQKISEKAAMQ